MNSLIFSPAQNLTNYSIHGFDIFVLLFHKQIIPYQAIMYLNYRYLSSLELENALRRSRVEAEVVVSKIIAEEDLRRSRVQVELLGQRQLKQNALRRSRVEAKVAEQNSNLRRSRLQEETNLVVLQKQEAVRRCRVQANYLIEEANRRAQIRRKQLQAQIATQLKTIELENQSLLKRAENQAQTAKTLAAQRKSRLESEIENERVAFEEVIRRRKLEAEAVTKKMNDYQALQKSKIQAETLAYKLAQEQNAQRSRILRQLEAQRLIRNEEIIKSRIANETAQRAFRETLLIKQISGKENLTDNLLRRQRIQRELEHAQLRRLYRI